MQKIHLVALTTFLIIFPAHGASRDSKMAHSTPIGLGLVAPVQFPPQDFTVNGLRLSGILGINRKVRGIDLGLLGSMTDQEFTGLAIAGVINLNKQLTTVVGLQLAGVVNLNKGQGSVYGVQAALAANLSKYMNIYGLQIGLYNRARTVHGLQIGLVNVVANLKGIQIGLANFNEGGPFGVSPIINVGY